MAARVCGSARQNRVLKVAIVDFPCSQGGSCYQATDSLGQGIKATGRPRHDSWQSEFPRFSVVLFVPRFRRFRGDEFLEARIIPERIEHRIEPEQRRSERHVFGQRTGIGY